MDKHLIFPIIMLIIVILGGGILLYLLSKDSQKNKKKSKKEIEKEKRNITAQEFTNVKNIRDCFLFTKDGYIFTYIRVNSVPTDLFSEGEKRIFVNGLTAAFSGERKPYKSISLPKPVDLSRQIYKNEMMLSETGNFIEKDLIRDRIRTMQDIVMNNSANEYQFYYALWEKYYDGVEEDLLKRAIRIIEIFEEKEIQSHSLKEKEIVRLANLINNPAYVNLEDDEYEMSVPLVS